MEQADSVCPFEQKAVLYAYGELPEREAKELEEHLKKCPSCHISAETLKEAEKIISAKKDNPRNNIAGLIIARAADERLKSREKSFFRAKALAFSLAVLCIIAGYSVISGLNGMDSLQVTVYAHSQQDIFSDEEDDDLDYLYEEISSETEFWE